MSRSPLEKFRTIFKRSSSNSSRSNSTQSENNSLTMGGENYDYDEPPLTPLELHGYKSTTKHRLLNKELAEELRQHVPALLQISHDWELLYSIEQSGTSLQTLYDKCQPQIGESVNRRRGYLIVVQDTRKNIFGAYINEHLRPLDKKIYYGNGDCFLWKLEKGDVKDLNNKHQYIEKKEVSLNLKVFPFTSVNDFVIYSNNQFISVGSGDGKFGLWIDSNLSIGASDSVDTFGNEPLSDRKKFYILGLEIWKIC